jgi:hypothetical protein
VEKGAGSSAGRAGYEFVSGVLGPDLAAHVPGTEPPTGFHSSDVGTAVDRAWPGSWWPRVPVGAEGGAVAEAAAAACGGAAALADPGDRPGLAAALAQAELTLLTAAPITRGVVS